MIKNVICSKCSKGLTPATRLYLINNGEEYPICKKCLSKIDKAYQEKSYDLIMELLNEITKK